MLGSCAAIVRLPLARFNASEISISVACLTVGSLYKFAKYPPGVVTMLFEEKSPSWINILMTVVWQKCLKISFW